mgnify:CR=1 FL=1
MLTYNAESTAFSEYPVFSTASRIPAALTTGSHAAVNPATNTVFFRKDIVTIHLVTRQ